MWSPSLWLNFSALPSCILNCIHLRTTLTVHHPSPKLMQFVFFSFTIDWGCGSVWLCPSSTTAVYQRSQNNDRSSPWVHYEVLWSHCTWSICIFSWIGEFKFCWLLNTDQICINNLLHFYAWEGVMLQAGPRPPGCWAVAGRRPAFTKTPWEVGVLDI